MKIFPKVNRDEHYGEMVWTNRMMDGLRKRECLCLCCDNIKKCGNASGLLARCQDGDLALAVTRCPDWKRMTTPQEEL